MIDEPQMLASGAGGKLGWTAASILLAVVLLTLGSSWAGGEYAFSGVVSVLAGLAVALVAFSGRHRPRREGPPARLWPLAAVACASTNLLPALLFPNPMVTAGATVVLLGCVLALGTGPLEGRRWLALEVGIGADLALAATKMKWGQGTIDVFWFIQRASRQLLSRHNPYAAWYPTSTHVPPYVHFPFGPGVLLMAAPFRLLGDVRLSDAVAMVVIILTVAALARRHGGSLRAGRCVALALSLPFVPFMIENAWPEVYPVAGIGLWLLWRDRHPIWSIAALGLGLSALPTPAPLLALPWLWWPSARKEISAAALFALLLAAPFAIWTGPGRFLADTVGVQLHLGPRPDSLSLNGLLWHLHLGWLPWWVGISASGGFLIAAAVLGRRDWGSAMSLGATLTLIAFVTAKWAFFNYYFIVAVGFLLALAWLDPSLRSSVEVSAFKASLESPTVASASGT